GSVGSSGRRSPSQTTDIAVLGSSSTITHDVRAANRMTSPCSAAEHAHAARSLLRLDPEPRIRAQILPEGVASRLVIVFVAVQVALALDPTPLLEVRLPPTDRAATAPMPADPAAATPIPTDPRAPICR